MKETIKLVLVVILTLSLASCQAQMEENEIIDENQESSFTLNGAGE